MAAFAAFHGLSGSDYQARFDELTSEGYRILSLCIYGDAGDPRYAVVFVRRPGPDWIATHGLDASTFQDWFEAGARDGYFPALMSVTGSAANPRFAATMERTTGGLAHFGLISGPVDLPNTFEERCEWAKANGWILNSFSVYGSASDRRYAGVWIPNPASTGWNYHARDTAESFQQTFDAETRLGYRPAYVALSADGTYASLFVQDQSVGRWAARHGMTAEQYQEEFDLRAGEGMLPICVQAAGSGGGARFASIFAEHEPLGRVWTVRGPRVERYDAFDTETERFMRANGIRVGQLAIGRNGTVELARAYTWAEQGYRITEPTDLMRLASVSKMFTAAAIQALYDAGTLAPTDFVYPTLGMSGPADPRSDQITVQMLLDHTGGYDSDVGGDPVFRMRQIAIDQGLSGPLTKQALVDFMYGQMLPRAPGTMSDYSNYGYVLLGYLVEQVTGQSFIDYVRGTVLAPIGITDVRLARTLRSHAHANEVAYDDPGMGESAADPSSSALVPFCHGGEGWLTEVMDAGGGLCATATACVQFARNHLVWGNGPRPAPGGWWLGRTGSMAGVSSETASRGSDGVDWAFIFNTRDLRPTSSYPLSGYAAKIDELLNAV